MSATPRTALSPRSTSRRSVRRRLPDPTTPSTWRSSPDGGQQRTCGVAPSCGPETSTVAELYDGFSILTLLWLEALGFCERGESGAFVDGGTRISLGGALPINTNGGQLSAGRLHGLGFVHEACLQLRGQAGERQVGSAGVAVVAVGALPYVGCMLLRGAAA